jgi:hypothetical protein
MTTTMTLARADAATKKTTVYLDEWRNRYGPLCYSGAPGTVNQTDFLIALPANHAAARSRRTLSTGYGTYRYPSVEVRDSRAARALTASVSGATGPRLAS